MDFLTPADIQVLNMLKKALPEIKEKQDEIINLLKQNNEKIEKLKSEIKKEG